MSLHLCTHLSLAWPTFAYPGLFLKWTALLQGSSYDSRFSRIFSQLLKGNEAVIKTMSVKPGYFGTHNCRKGVGTMVAAGCIVSPPMVSICVRAGSIMSGVEDKYLKGENTGDQYVGRCESCLNQLEKKIAVRCPYLTSRVYQIF